MNYLRSNSSSAPTAPTSPPKDDTPWLISTTAKAVSTVAGICITFKLFYKQIIEILLHFSNEINGCLQWMSSVAIGFGFFNLLLSVLSPTCMLSGAILMSVLIKIAIICVNNKFVCLSLGSRV